MKLLEIATRSGIPFATCEYAAGVLGLSRTADLTSEERVRLANYLEHHTVGRSREEFPRQLAVVRGTPVEPLRPRPAPVRASIIVNFVWMGNNPLGALEKFNIFSWRALGHTVNIFTHHWTRGTEHTLETLGLEAGDANVITLDTELTADDTAAGVDNPRVVLTNARSVLTRWLLAVPVGTPPERDHIYNLVDLTKSYIGGSRRGIVLDMKVGPSPYVEDYAACFGTHFVSYSRGRNTAGRPENQCIGTMQGADTLRCLYATTFESNVTTNLMRDGNHNESWFNAITGFHGRAFEATRAGIDVATMQPSGAPVGGRFEVFEISGTSHGPFRVFKRADDQTNKGSGSGTTASQVRFLCIDVYTRELSRSGGDEGFIDKARLAKDALPR